MVVVVVVVVLVESRQLGNHTHKHGDKLCQRSHAGFL